MDFESEGSVLESVDDNEEIKDVIISDTLGIIKNNGSCVVKNSDNGEINNRIADVLASVNSPPMNIKMGLSPTPSTSAKGHGLKKWRRIKRDVNKSGDSIIDTGKLVTQDLTNSRGNPSKRQIIADSKQKSEGSCSSTNVVVKSTDGFSLLDDSGLMVGPSFAAGTDSENSEDRSSKSSTAASVPKLNLEIPVVTGFPRDRSKIKISSGKNMTHSVHHGHQGKGRVETTKKARGERVKIEKENSHSSMESDSRNSNFVFVQAIYSTSNGARTGRSMNYDEENCNEVQGREHQVSEGLRVGGCDRDGEVGYEENTPEDVVDDSSWEFKEERNENQSSSSDPGIVALQSILEALEKEVLGYKQIGKDSVSVDPVSDLGSEYIDVEEKSQEPNGEKLPSSRFLQSKMVGTAKKEVETELEELFTQKIEAEIEYLVISTTLQNVRVAAANEITILDNPKALASEKSQILVKLENTENNAAMLEKEANSENICEDTVTVDETMKLQKRVCKYTSCFFFQLALFVIILGVFIVQLSPNYVDFVPT